MEQLRPLQAYPLPHDRFTNDRLRNLFFLLPVPLVGMLMFGNLLHEMWMCGVFPAQNEVLNATTIF